MLSIKEGYIAVIGCKRCYRCENACTQGALYRIDGLTRVDHDRCTLCMACLKICPNKALIFIE